MPKTTPPLATDVAIRPGLTEQTTAILRAILSATDYGVLLTDLDHQSVACNRRFGEIFGLSIEEVVSLEPEVVRQKLYPRLEDPDRWRDQLMEIYADPHLEFEDELTLLGPPNVVMRRYTGPVTDDSGALIGRIWTFLDITRLKQQQRIQQTLYEVSTLFDPSPASTYESVLQKLADFYGGATAAITLRDGKQVTFKAVVNAPEWAAGVRGLPLEEAYCQRVLKTNEPCLIQDVEYDAEFRFFKTVGLGWTRYLGAPVRDSKGKPIGTLCILDARSDWLLNAEDQRFISLMAMRVSAEIERERIVEERISEQQNALQFRERQLTVSRRVLQAMNDGFRLIGSRVSDDFWRQSQLRALRGVLGIQACAFLQQTETGVWEGCLLAKEDPKAKPLLLSADPAIAALMDRLQDSPSLSIDWDAPALTEVAQALATGYTGVLRLHSVHNTPQAMLVLGVNSISSLNEPFAWAHLEALAEQVGICWQARALQTRLEQTDLELQETQQQLVQREKLAVVGTLAASIAHDIRNIASSLSLSLSMNDYDPQFALQEARAQLDRFNLLVHRLLSYARPRLMASEEVDLTALMRKVLTLTAASIRVGRVTLETDCQPDLPPVKGDPHQLEHLFVNMVLNAVQAMTAEGGVLKARITSFEGKVIVEIEDNGSGIPPEKMATLFEPFHSKRSGGFGLGLFSCKRIVESHGGDIEVDSQPGKGTTVIVRLPVAARVSKGRKRGDNT